MSSIKFGTWGVGRIGGAHTRFFAAEKEMYELVAACDLRREQIDKLVGDYQCAGYDDADKFLAAPNMELVIIATQSVDHVEHASRALAAGKIVLLDKPIAVTTNDYERLLELDKTYSDKLFFLHNLRFTPAFQHVKRLVEGGLLGEIQMVKIRWHHPFRRRADWQTLLKYGGGQLSCWGPHTIDWALRLINAPVKDAWGNLKRVNSLGDADDHVKIMLLGENDVVGDVEISYAVAFPEPIFTVYGSRGSLVCPDQRKIKMKYIDPEYAFSDKKADEGAGARGGHGEDEEFPWCEETIDVEPTDNMWDCIEVAIARHLYKAIREDVPFPITNADALEVVRVTEMVKKQNSQFDWLQ